MQLAGAVLAARTFCLLLVLGLLAPRAKIPTGPVFAPAGGGELCKNVQNNECTPRRCTSSRPSSPPVPRPLSAPQPRMQ